MVLSAFACAPAFAQLDRVYTLNSSTAISGQIQNVTKSGVTIKSGGNTQDIAADQIKKILFEGDPAPLTNGREFALDGQYDQALPLLTSLDPTSLKREIVQADAIYYRILSQGELALAGKGDKKAAAAGALAFVGKFSDSWHFYSAAKLLGDLALATDSYDAAMKYYGSLRSAPSVESKIQSVYLTGLALLKKGELDAASIEFDKVAGLSVQSVEAARLQKLAKAGKAMAMAKIGKTKEGIELVKTLITDLNATDVEVAAAIYNAQGANYEAAGDLEGAVMAYLHTHLMFSSDPRMHAEALAKLAQLWPQVGKPERAAEAKQELQQRYPGLAG